MKKIIICLFLLSTYFGYSQSIDSALKKYMDEITADELKGMLYFIASDQMEGRFPGSLGEKMTANYLATKYMEMGIFSGNGEASQSEDYYQKFTFKFKEN